MSHRYFNKLSAVTEQENSGVRVGTGVHPEVHAHRTVPQGEHHLLQPQTCSDKESKESTGLKDNTVLCNCLGQWENGEHLNVEQQELWNSSDMEAIRPRGANTSVA